MAPFSNDAILLLVVVGMICLLTFLYALATLYRDQTKLHDLKVRVHELRSEYAARVARQHAEQLEAELGPPSHRLHATPAPAAPAGQAERPRVAA